MEAGLSEAKAEIVFKVVGSLAISIVAALSIMPSGSLILSALGATSIIPTERSYIRELILKLRDFKLSQIVRKLITDKKIKKAVLDNENLIKKAISDNVAANGDFISTKLNLELAQQLEAQMLERLNDF